MKNELETLTDVTPIAGVDGGPVMIFAGPHKGKLGLWDDDEGEKAVVYLFGGKSVVVKPENLAAFEFNNQAGYDKFFELTVLAAFRGK
jgi:hypothetical protein